MARQVRAAERGTATTIYYYWTISFSNECSWLQRLSSGILKLTRKKGKEDVGENRLHDLSETA